MKEKNKKVKYTIAPFDRKNLMDTSKIKWAGKSLTAGEVKKLYNK